MKPRPEPYEYLDWHTDARANHNDHDVDLGRSWPACDPYDPDDREPMGGDPYWAGDLEW